MSASERLASVSKSIWPNFFRLTHDRFWADELVQVASLKCWEFFLATGEMPVSPIDFMFRVGRNHFLDDKRKRTRERPYPLDFIPEERKNHVTEIDNAEIFAQIMAELEKRPRWAKALIESVYLQSRRQHETTEKKNSTVRTRLKRILDQLRRRFRN